MFKQYWNDVPVKNFIIETRKRTRVIWLGNHPGLTRNGMQIGNHILVNLFNETNTLTREYFIDNCHVWNDFINSCYYLSCDGGKSWENEDGQKQSFKEWMIVNNHREKSSYVLDMERFADNTIITVFDNIKEKRLIIDGQHRASAITIACEKKDKIPKVRILECYGKSVSLIFPCDVYQL